MGRHLETGDGVAHRGLEDRRAVARGPAAAAVIDQVRPRRVYGLHRGARDVHRAAGVARFGLTVHVPVRLQGDGGMYET